MEQNAKSSVTLKALTIGSVLTVILLILWKILQMFNIKRRVRHKFGAKACETDGIKFPSLLERNCYLCLKQLQEQQQIRFFLRQVRFDLPGGHKHLVDFAVFTLEEVIFIEAKGRDLETGKLKRDQSEAIYGIDIHIAKHPTDCIEIINSSKRIAGEGKTLC